MEGINDSRIGGADPDEECIDDIGECGLTDNAYLSSVDPCKYGVELRVKNYDEIFHHPAVRR